MPAHQFCLANRKSSAQTPSVDHRFDQFTASPTKKAIADVKAAAKECTEDAIKTLKSVMKDESKPAAARVGAAIAILDRGWGKPMQAVEASVSILDQMTDDEQKMLLAALEALKSE